VLFRIFCVCVCEENNYILKHFIGTNLWFAQLTEDVVIVTVIQRHFLSFKNPRAISSRSVA